MAAGSGRPNRRVGNRRLAVQRAVRHACLCEGGERGGASRARPRASPACAVGFVTTYRPGLSAQQPIVCNASPNLVAAYSVARSHSHQDTTSVEMEEYSSLHWNVYDWL